MLRRTLLVAGAMVVALSAWPPAQTVASDTRSCGGTAPWSHGTPCLVTVTPVNNGMDVDIASPVVDQPQYDYPTVTFQPGDIVTVSAGGCVQTGGSGATWKRYVNPQGANSGSEYPGLYHGTITIPGAFVNGQQVQGWSINRIIETTTTGPGAAPVQIRAPVGPPRTLMLTLGYRDDADGYGDNGYWGHDNGNYDQCVLDRDGGNAHVHLTIRHGPPQPLPPVPPKPFDLASTTYDSSFTMANPSWGWQVQHNGTGRYNVDCNQRINVPAPSWCASQVTYINPAPDPSWFSLSPWRKVKNFFGLCGDPNTSFPSKEVVGHLNWNEVTYTSASVRFLDWSGDLVGDDDYNVAINANAPPAQSPTAGITPPTAEGGAIKGEFDSNETIDNFDTNSWWHAFHRAVDQVFYTRHLVPINPVSAAEKRRAQAWLDQNINGHEAVVTGVMGLDGVHGADPGSEIHPVHVLALRANSTPSVDNDHWALFVRNWGNEGECSTRQENVDLTSMTVRIPPPPATPPGYVPNIISSDVQGHDLAASVYDIWPDQTGLYLTFHLKPAEAHSMAFGDLHVQWTPAPGPSLRHVAPAPLSDWRSPRRALTAAARRASSDPERGEPERLLRDGYRSLSRSQRRVYRSLATPWHAALSASPASALTGQQAVSPPPLPPRQPIVTATLDPTHVSAVTNRLWALAVASRGRVVPLPCRYTARTCAAAARVPSVLTAPGAPGRRGKASVSVAGGSVSFLGGRMHPTMVVRSVGLGASAPRGRSADRTTCGTYRSNGRWYSKSTLSFVDETHSWAAGMAGPGHTGTCIGLRVISWSPNRVMLRFGGAYGTFDHWLAYRHDVFTLIIRGRQLRDAVRYTGRGSSAT